MDTIRYANHDMLWDIAIRELTFRGRWDNKKIKARTLARAGLFYHGSDLACCIYCNCNFVINDTDNIYKIHKRASPKCDFHLGTAIPGLNDYMLKTDKEYREKTFSLFLYEWPDINMVKRLVADGYYYVGPGQTVFCAYCQSSNISHECENIIKNIKFKYKKVDFLFMRERVLLGILGHQPDHPDMQDLESRMETVPPEMALSGYFKYKTNIKCFHCSTVANKWKPGEDIDNYHRRSAPDCLFIRIIQEETPPTNPVLAINMMALKKVAPKSRYVCKVCFKIPSDIVLMPCNHLCCCMACVDTLQECPMCHQFIDATITPFL